MRAVVCCKGVPLNALPGSVQAENGELNCINREFYINESDEYALEVAASLKKNYNAETWAVTVGPLASQEALYMAMAKGIDHVYRIGSSTERPELVANALIAVLRELQPQVVLTGIQSEDWMGSEVGVLVAEGLGAALSFATVEVSQLDNEKIRVKREIGGGRKLDVVLKLPAVLCIQSGIQALQYVSALKRKKVKENPIKLWGKVEEIEVPANIKSMQDYQFIDVAIPEARSQATMISGNKSEKAQELLKIIKKNLIV